MKTHSFLFAVILGFSLLAFPCWGNPKEFPKMGPKQEVQPSAETFTAFSPLEFSYFDEHNEKQTIMFSRNDSVLNSLDQLLKKDIPDIMDPDGKRSLKKLRNALRLLYGKDTAQDTFRAIALLHDLADVKKPYSPKNWGLTELQCHAAAKCILSLCYQDGVGVPKDLNRGLILMKEACFFDQFGFDKNGIGWENNLDGAAYPLATLEMSVRFLGGIDVNPNFIKGLILLGWTDDQGNSVAHNIQETLSAVSSGPDDVPEKFRQYKSLDSLIRAMEGFSALDISRMQILERTNRAKEEQKAIAKRQDSPPVAPADPSRPTPNVHVQKAMNQLVAFEKIRTESLQMTGQRMQCRPGNLGGFLGEIGDIRSVTQHMATYVQNLQTINISACPADFQVAFVFYVQCEANYVGLLAGMTHPENNGGNDIWEGLLGGIFVAGLAGEQVEKDLYSSREKLFDLATKKYGVQLESK
ncbi:MAG: SEL1-like repeat protein [Thermoguttaceae bacterium]|nr:SEL1-like repeat protein [Thermoguttaceae bacterium]